MFNKGNRFSHAEKVSKILCFRLAAYMGTTPPPPVGVNWKYFVNLTLIKEVRLRSRQAPRWKIFEIWPILLQLKARENFYNIYSVLVVFNFIYRHEKYSLWLFALFKCSFLNRIINAIYSFEFSLDLFFFLRILRNKG